MLNRLKKFVKGEGGFGNPQSITYAIIIAVLIGAMIGLSVEHGTKGAICVVAVLTVIIVVLICNLAIEHRKK